MPGNQETQQQPQTEGDILAGADESTSLDGNAGLDLPPGLEDMFAPQDDPFDELLDGLGEDHMYGGDGADRFYGGGHDTLYGGDGADGLGDGHDSGDGDGHDSGEPDPPSGGLGPGAQTIFGGADEDEFGPFGDDADGTFDLSDIFGGAGGDQQDTDPDDILAGGSPDDGNDGPGLPAGIDGDDILVGGAEGHDDGGHDGHDSGEADPPSGGLGPGAQTIFGGAGEDELGPLGDDADRTFDLSDIFGGAGADPDDILAGGSPDDGNDGPDLPAGLGEADPLAPEAPSGGGVDGDDILVGGAELDGNDGPDLPPGLEDLISGGSAPAGDDLQDSGGDTLSGSEGKDLPGAGSLSLGDLLDDATDPDEPSDAPLALDLLGGPLADEALSLGTEIFA